MFNTNFLILIIYKPIWDDAKCHKKLGPITDQFSCFDVYWIQTDRQAKYI